MGNIDEELIKDVGCVACKKFLDIKCKCHTRGHDCVNFVEREDRKRERRQMDKDKKEHIE